MGVSEQRELLEQKLSTELALVRFKEQEDDSVAGVDGAKGEKLEDEVREMTEPRPHRASALTMASHGGVLTL